MKKALLCVGNELRGDDGLGIEFGREVEKRFKDWRVFYGFDTPENEIYAIKDFSPSILIIADAAVTSEDLRAEFMENEAGVAFNTHSLPLHIMQRYLAEFCPRILFLALFVKPENFEGISQNLSEHARETLEIGLEKFKGLDEILKVC